MAFHGDIRCGTAVSEPANWLNRHHFPSPSADYRALFISPRDLTPETYVAQRWNRAAPAGHRQSEQQIKMSFHPVALNLVLLLAQGDAHAVHAQHGTAMLRQAISLSKQRASMQTSIHRNFHVSCFHTGGATRGTRPTRAPRRCGRRSVTSCASTTG